MCQENHYSSQMEKLLCGTQEKWVGIPCSQVQFALIYIFFSSEKIEEVAVRMKRKRNLY